MVYPSGTSLLAHKISAQDLRHPRDLTDDYLKGVRDRMFTGNMKESDYAYLKEAQSRKILPGAGKQIILGRASDSRILGRNLEAFGFIRPPNSAAHHIVAGGDKRAAAARSVLKRENIDINDPDNGVFLHVSIHNPIHTDEYYEKITRRIVGAQRGKVREELRKIRDEIKKGTF